MFSLSAPALLGEFVSSWFINIHPNKPRYMAATWFSRFPEVKVRFVEKRNKKLFAGQADGLQSRTLEVFQSFGFADRALKEANHMMEVSCILEISQAFSDLIRSPSGTPARAERVWSGPAVFPTSPPVCPDLHRSCCTRAGSRATSRTT